MPSIDLSTNDIKQLLDHEATRINSPKFICNDPVQFPRRFSSTRDIEITALLAATIAWGNRKMICSNCDKLLRLMGNQPHSFVMSQSYLDLNPADNIHRTFFVGNLQHYLNGLHRIYSRHDSLADFARRHRVADSNYPSWLLVEKINEELIAANDGVADSRCLPQNLATTALKRVNMALRWLVRDDGIVDIGIWKDVIPKSKLFIPLDVHVGNIARQLGLLQRNANDRKATVQLTETLRQFRPDDPVFYDYALFGIGIGE